MTEQPRIFEVVPVVRGERLPRVPVGEFTRDQGISRCITYGHMVMRANPGIEYVRVYATHPDRDQPTYLGMVRRGVRKLVRE